jgi:hypothetical protein
MVGEVTPPSKVTVMPTDLLFRGIHPMYFQQGQLTSGVFILKKKHEIHEGPSVGVERLIPLTNFRAHMCDGWGVGRLPVSVPQSQSLTVHPLPYSEWGEHADAHAVITDYQKLTDRARNDVARFLRDALQKDILIKPSEQTTST